MKKDIQIRFRVSERENEIIKLEEKKYKNRSEFFRMLLEEKLPEGERRGVQTELEKSEWKSTK